MNIVIISCFRNATRHIDRYFDQMQTLRKLLYDRGDWLTLLLGYGDSTDGTGEMLFEQASVAIGAQLIDVSHGGPHFGSIEHPQRFRQLAKMGNTLLDCVSPDADVVGIVESDLVWDADTLDRLIVACHVWGLTVAPMVMDSPPANTFYDTYAFRRYGQRFTKQPPYMPPARSGHLFSKLTPLDSAGSVLMMPGNMARQVRFTENEVIVGLCNDIRARGGHVMLDSDSMVYHP